MVVSLAAILVISLVFLFLVHRFAQFISYVVIPVCIVMVIFSINLMMAYPTQEVPLSRSIWIILMFIGVLLVCSVCKNCRSVRLYATFLKAASQVVASRWSTILYIPIYLACLILFFALLGFEAAGFWSNGTHMYIPSQSVYYKLDGFTFSTGVFFLLAIQLIWGISFIK